MDSNRSAAARAAWISHVEPERPTIEKVPSRKEPFPPLAHTTTAIIGARNAAPIKNRERSEYGSGSRYLTRPALFTSLRPRLVRHPEERRCLRARLSGDDRRRSVGDRPRQHPPGGAVSPVPQAVGQRQRRPALRGDVPAAGRGRREEAGRADPG